MTLWKLQLKELCKLILFYLILTFFLRAVINKTVAPLNPMDAKPVQMYIYNNIFFSYAIDTNDRYEVL